MLYIIITLGIVLNVSVWTMVYAEHKRAAAIEAAAAEEEAQFWADWSWDITKEAYWPRLKAQCADSRRRIEEYHRSQTAEYKESVRLSSILS
jgi:hypothetical protein